MSVFIVEYFIIKLYIVDRSSGTSRDWAYRTMNIPYVFTIELRDKGEHGWELPPDQILPTGEETWAGFRAMLLAIINGK